ncbi:MAG: hypothetical protein HKO90_03025 [Flavobacteriaceae bacterium]|nr:hypothetical protein [Flavobacteriaceae bacterium]
MIAKRFRLVSLFLFFVTHSIITYAQTTVEKINDRWQISVSGTHFKIKGETFGYEHHPENSERYFKELQFLGVNTIRLWATGENTPALLDMANQYGIKVMVGIWMLHGLPGMEDDDSFNYLEDTSGIEVVYENALHTVKKYKDHPAVLTRSIGNEVCLNSTTDQWKKYIIKTRKIDLSCIRSGLVIFVS